MVCQWLLERYDRDESVPADRDIAEVTYSTEKHTLSVNYHCDSARIIFASRQYSKLVQGDGGDDDIEWNTKHHAVYHVIIIVHRILQFIIDPSSVSKYV